MDSGAHFSIAFVTADKTKNKGGEWIVIEEAWKRFEPATAKIISKNASKPH